MAVQKSVCGFRSAPMASSLSKHITTLPLHCAFSTEANTFKPTGDKGHKEQLNGKENPVLKAGS
jgi:hypothetical protein